MRLKLMAETRVVVSATKEALADKEKVLSEEDRLKLSNFKEMMEGNRFLYHWCDMFSDSRVYAFFIISAGASP